MEDSLLYIVLLLQPQPMGFSQTS